MDYIVLRPNGVSAAARLHQIALIQDPKVRDRILQHLRDKGPDAQAGPWATGRRVGGAVTDAP